MLRFTILLASEDEGQSLKVVAPDSAGPQLDEESLAGRRARRQLQDVPAIRPDTNLSGRGRLVSAGEDDYARRQTASEHLGDRCVGASFHAAPSQGALASSR